MLPLVITIESETGSKRRYAFADSPVRIGRSPLAELQFTEPFVSRWQGTIRFSASEITYCNVSSTNVTLVGDREAGVDDEVGISPEIPLRIGSIVLRFSREPVPESDVRRKGKSKPAVGTQEVAKTMWLGDSSAFKLPADLGASQAPATARNPGSEHLDAPSPSSQAPKAAPGVQISAQRIIPLQEGAKHVVATRAVSPPIGSRAEASTPAPPSVARPDPSGSAPAPAPESKGAASGARKQDGDLEWHYAQYRTGWGHLFGAVSSLLERARPEARQAIADDLQRRYPQIAHELEFRELLKRHGIEPRKIDIPEITAWLRGIAEGILPPKFHLDTGMTLQRMLALLEVLTQSFAEINDAQQSVRARWLGRAPRASVIRSDDGRVVLAYLLNPKGDWDERMGELEDAAREVVVHEFALFKATLGGARELLELLSPAAIAEAEGIDESELEQGESPGLWKRFSKDSPEQRLWRRFVAVYEGLMDGDRYQRAFLGRAFARTYLAAMGTTDTHSGNR